jgi:ATP-binding cassette, subfamily B, multidrug efflux pump
MKSFRTLWPYFAVHRRRLTVGLLSLVICDFFQLMIPRVTKHAVDHLSSDQATGRSLAVAGLAVVVLAFGVGLFRFAWRLMILGFSRLVEKDIRSRLYNKLLILPPVWFMSRRTGDIMAHATNDLEAIRMAAGLGQVALVDAVIMGTASIGFMVWINPQLTLLALIPMPLIPLLTRYLGRLMHQRYRVVQDTFGELTGQAREYLSGIRVVAAHGREDLALGDFDRTGRRYIIENIRLFMISGAFFPLMLMVTNISMVIIIYFGGRMTVLDAISPGDFVAFISYLGLLTWPMMAMGWVTNLVQRGAASLDRVNGLLDMEPDVKDPLHPVPMGRVQGNVSFRHLTFRYPDREEPVLNDISLDCRAGEITALVGRTGSGKSTMLNLIPRLLNPPEKSVYLDHYPVEQYALSQLRSVIGYVPQDGYTFSGTMADNIAFGRPDAGTEDIRLAAKAAHLDEEIMAFPKGYQTIVGERGVTLSGGQKQRVALARAILMDPEILLLDDTLSSLDATTEETIVTNLAERRIGRTTILSSHRLTSLRIADRIHVLEDGHVSQSGSHDELMVQGGYYAHLYHLQSAETVDARDSAAPVK